MHLDTKTLSLSFLISLIGTLLIISMLTFSSGTPTGNFFLWDMFDEPEEHFEGEFIEEFPEEGFEEEFPHEEPYIEEGYEEEHYPEEEFPEGEWFEGEFFPEGFSPEMIEEMELIEGFSESEEEEEESEESSSSSGGSSGSSTKPLTQPTMPSYMGTDKFITGWEMVGKTCAVSAYDMKTKSAGSGYCKVYCPQGKRVLGGGFGDIGVTTSLLENGPVFEKDWYGWDAWVSSENMISGDFSVYAICAKVDTTISTTP